MGADLALDVRTEKVTDAMQKLGMKEGFDVALEMSGNPKAFEDILPNMFHGGKIALLGIMPGNAAIDWNTSYSARSQSKEFTAAKCTKPGTK